MMKNEAIKNIYYIVLILGTIFFLTILTKVVRGLKPTIIQITKTDTIYCLDGTAYYPFSKKTASGFSVNMKTPIKDKGVALPRYMLKHYRPNAPFDFGDTIIVTGPIPYTGEWIVRDCTAKRIKGRVDFCISKGCEGNLWKGIYIKKK